MALERKIRTDICSGVLLISLVTVVNIGFCNKRQNRGRCLIIYHQMNKTVRLVKDIIEMSMGIFPQIVKNPDRH